MFTPTVNYIFSPKAEIPLVQHILNKKAGIRRYRPHIKSTGGLLLKHIHP